MKAIVFREVESLEHVDVPDPVLLGPRDAIVRVRTAGLCGSDLHPYFGRERGLDDGTVMGHEFVGEIVELGEEAAERGAVFGIGVGTRVVAPFTTSCGDCVHCRSGLTARCERGELFGWVQDGTGLHGAQAEYVRVPLADATLVPVPDDLADDALALLAGDILSTGLFGAELARVGSGDVVAVVGCGPVGLLAIRAAFARGASRVFAVDPVPGRRERAREFGATPLDPAGDPGAHLRRETGGVGADAAIEAAGGDAATRLAAGLLRPGGVLGAVAVHTEPHLALSPGEMYDRNLVYAAGRCPARRFLPEALEMAAAEGELLSTMISHRLPLSEGVEAYRRFGAREAGWAKVVFTLDEGPP